MRLEFQVRRLGESAALIDTGYEELEKALDRLRDEPAWLGFFASPRTMVRPYPPKGGRERGWSREETLAALRGLAERLGKSDADLLTWLGWAAERVEKEPAGARFEPFVMDD